MDTLTSGTVTLLRVLFCEWEQTTEADGLQWMYEAGASQCYSIIQHPIETQWLLVMEYTDIRLQWHYRVLILWCQSSTTGGRMVSKWMCEGERLMLHNQAPNWNTLTPCDGYTHIRYSDITTCIDSVVPGSTTVDGWSQMNCVEESSLMLT